jgi:hypothetical protein
LFNLFNFIEPLPQFEIGMLIVARPMAFELEFVKFENP